MKKKYTFIAIREIITSYFLLSSSISEFEFALRFLYAISIRKYKRERSLESRNDMFQKKENKKDIRLAMAWQQGDKEAGEELLLKYMPLIMKLSAHHYSSCGWEDMRQELTIAFLESAKKYTTTMTIPFSAYIKKRIQWARVEKITKLKVIEDHESLDIEEQEEGFYEMDLPSSVSLDFSKIASLAHLTKKQRLIFPLWLQGKSISFIHLNTGISIRCIQILIQNIRKSLHTHSNEIRLYLSENY